MTTSFPSLIRRLLICLPLSLPIGGMAFASPQPPSTPVRHHIAQPKQLDLGPFPLSDVKSPYATLSIPTKLAPVSKSLSELLNHDYHISNMAPYPQGVLLLLTTLHTPPEKPQQILCVLTPPTPGTDNNVPTSRCWLIN